MINNYIQDETANKNKRLSFIFLDVFFGGFIVSIVMVITLGRPTETEISDGSGGLPVIVVEYFWKDKFKVLSPIIFHEDNMLHKLGYASPATTGNHIWLRHNTRSDGKLNGRLSSGDNPYYMVMMDGFHLNPEHTFLVKDESSNNYYNYGMIIISQPCSGKWEFGLRSVEVGIGADNSSNIDAKVRISYSYGPNSQQTTIERDLTQLIDRRHIQNEKLFEPLSETLNNPYIVLLTLDEMNELEYNYCTN